MKRMLAILFMIALLLCCSTVTFANTEEVYNQYNKKYYITEINGTKSAQFMYDIIDGEATINDVHVYEDNTDLIFPAVIDGYPVKTVDNINFVNTEKSKIVSIRFENGIEKVLDFHLAGSSTLETVSFGDSIEEFGDVDFTFCKNLRELKLPQNLKIGEFCFFDCENLESVTIPESVETLYDTCFGNCFNLKNVTMGNHIKLIGKEAFMNCNSLEEITIPSSVNIIGSRAFVACRNLKKVKMSDNVTYIGEHAFDKTALQNIELSKKLKELGAQAFARTQIKELTVPSSVETIGEYAFSNCEMLAKLTISDTTNVNKYALTGCKNLSDVTVNGKMKRDLFEALLRADVQKIAPCIQKFYDEYDGDFVIFDGNYLAKYKGSDRNPVIPEGITELGGQAFHGADIDSITFPSAEIKEIPSHCFQSSKIKELTIPSTVKNIRDYAFYGCYNLEKLTIESGVKSVSDNAFINCSSLSEDNVNIAKGVVVGKEAFKQTPLDKEWMDGQDADETPKPTKMPQTTDKPSATHALKTLMVNGDMSIKVDDNAVNFPDAKPFIDENDRTQIPIRAIAEMLDCSVDWNDETKTATITNKDGDVVKITIDSETLTKNGEKIEMGTAAIIKDERTYIPIRFVAEAMGLTVEWKN